MSPIAAVSIIPAQFYTLSSLNLCNDKIATSVNTDEDSKEKEYNSMSLNHTDRVDKKNQLDVTFCIPLFLF